MEIDDKKQLRAGKKVGDDILEQIDSYVMSRQDEVYNEIGGKLKSLIIKKKSQDTVAVETTQVSLERGLNTRYKKIEPSRMRNKVFPKVAQPGQPKLPESPLSE